MYYILYRGKGENKMGRLTKFLLAVVIAFSMTGCGGGNNYNEQKDIVDSYFKYIKQGKLKKLENLMNRNAEDEFGGIEFIEAMDEGKSLMDEDLGGAFQKEFDGFIDEVCDRVISEYEIGKITEDADEIKIKVTGKYLLLEDLDTDVDMGYDDEDLKKILEDYANGNTDLDEYEKAITEYYETFAKDIFGDWKKQLKKLGTKRFTATFTLVEKRNKWVIDGVKSKQSIGGLDASVGFGGSNDDYDTYQVDDDKCKAENTKLGKGRLVDSYRNEKYVETPFEFIDFNVNDSQDQEMDKYDFINFKNLPLKLDVEVAGNVGDTFVLLVEDDDDTVLLEEELTLTEAQQVFSKEINEIYEGNSSLSIHLYLASTYNKEYHYGDSFGYIYIYNDN